MISVSYASKDWGSINNGSGLGEQNDSGSEGNINDSVIEDVIVTSNDKVEENSSSDIKYTRDFYIAILLGVIGLFIVGLFIYLFIREPKNKWKKRSVQTRNTHHPPRQQPKTIMRFIISFFDKIRMKPKINMPNSSNFNSKL